MSLFPIIRSKAYYNNRRLSILVETPRWREPRPCSSWGQVAHVLTPDNFRLSPGKKDFTASQGLRTSLPRSSVRNRDDSSRLEPERCGSPFLFDRVKKLASAADAE